jgi:hypothetical protein
MINITPSLAPGSGERVGVRNLYSIQSFNNWHHFKPVIHGIVRQITVRQIGIVFKLIFDHQFDIL